MNEILILEEAVREIFETREISEEIYFGTEFYPFLPLSEEGFKDNIPRYLIYETYNPLSKSGGNN